MEEHHCIYEKELGMLIERTESYERDLETTIKNDKEWKRNMAQEVGELQKALSTVIARMDDILNSKALRVQIWAAIILSVGGIFTALISIWTR